MANTTTSGRPLWLLLPASAVPLTGTFFWLLSPQRILCEVVTALIGASTHIYLACLYIYVAAPSLEGNSAQDRYSFLVAGAQRRYWVTSLLLALAGLLAPAAHLLLLAICVTRRWVQPLARHQCQ
jgi:hypothetical protein